MKKLTIFFILVVISFCNGLLVVRAEDDNIEFSLEYYHLGKKPYWSSIGETVKIGVDINNYDTLRVLTLKKENNDGSSDYVENPLDISNINVKSEYSDILSANKCGNYICLESLSEGISNLTIVYKYDNKNYEIEIPWQVTPKEIPYFSLNYKVPVLLNFSTIYYNIDDTEKIEINFGPLTTELVTYPDGYSEENYYKYEWKVLDDSIVNIIDDSSKSSVIIKGISEGTTQVECIVSTINESDTPIKKVVSVNVNKDKENDEDIIKINPKYYDEKKSINVPNTKKNSVKKYFISLGIVLILISAYFVLKNIIRRIRKESNTC